MKLLQTVELKNITKKVKAKNDDATEVLHALLVTAIDHIPDLVVHTDHVLDREIDVEDNGVGVRDEEEVELVLEKEKEEREVVVHVEEVVVEVDLVNGAGDHQLLL